jgi:serine/threonine protein kinase
MPMNTVPLTDRGYAIPNDELRDLVSQSAAVVANDDANLDKTCVNVVTPKPQQPAMVRQLGRYEIVRKLGEGGMGAVFLARDTATGEQVALKVLSEACLKQPGAFERFEKEARLLEEAHNPHIANMLDLGSDGDTRFLVMEFVDGCDLRRWLNNRGQLDETTALDIVSDLCRALSSIHSRGMVHRDIKPENVLLSNTTGSERPVVKLTDFGLARHVDQSDSLKLTQTGALLGTPYYMAPEQFKGTGELSSATDVYALGITLFELLAGRRPFTANDPIKLATSHCFDMPPDLRKLAESVTDGVADLVLRMLSKNPANRPPDAASLLEEILRLQCGRAAQLALHPTLPVHDAAKVLVATFEWELAAAPAELWQYVSDTDRFNQAAGIPPVAYEMVREEGGRFRKFGQFRMGGMTIKWEEHPFEWVEGRQFSILREFAAGPFVWFLSTVELEDRPEGGTYLKHHVKILPRGLAGRMLAGLEVGIKGRRNLDRIYRRIDATLKATSQSSNVIDHFQKPAGPSRVQRLRLRSLLDELRSAGVSDQIASTFQDLLTNSAPQDLARLRPYAVARRFGLPEREVVDAFLHAVRCGLLTMSWDLICPTCRLAADAKQTLREIDQHANCSACQVDFKVDFGSSIELVFKTPPEIRTANSKLYCNGGPGNFPHVVAQVTLEPGERLLLTLGLDTGSYIVRGPRLPYTVHVEIDPRDGVRHGSVRCAPGFDRQPPVLLRSGHQQLTLENAFTEKQLIRVERNVRRADALTAAEATSLPLFREHFPRETLDPDQLVQLATSNFLVIQLDHLDDLFRDHGDSGAYLRVRDFLQAATRHVHLNGGTAIDEQPGMLLANFPHVAAAYEAARDAVKDLVSKHPEHNWSLSGSLHRGSALVTSDRSGIRYFGATVNDTVRLSRRSPAGRLLLTYDAWSDPGAVVALADHLRPFTDEYSTADDSLRQIDLTSRPAGVAIAASREGYSQC